MLKSYQKNQNEVHLFKYNYLKQDDSNLTTIKLKKSYKRKSYINKIYLNILKVLRAKRRQLFVSEGRATKQGGIGISNLCCYEYVCHHSLGPRFFSGAMISRA